MWNSSMEPSGHMSLTYFFFVPLYSYWGCNNNSSSNHGQWLFFKIKRHAYAHSLSRAIPRDWLPGDIAAAGNECARSPSAKFLRKPEAPWYALHTFVKAVLLRVCWHHQVSVYEMVPHVGKVLLWFSLWAALVMVTCKLHGDMQKQNLVSLLSLAWNHESPRLSFWDSKCT